MAVARYLSDPQPQAQQININSQGGANPSGIAVGNGQPVDFNNNSGSTISINFANTAITQQRVFNDIPNLAAGQSFAESPLIDDVTVNYTVAIGANTFGPYAIEVGSGPLQVSVTNAVPDPEISVIPPNGEIQFAATDVDCSISWKNNNDPFTPPVDGVYVGQSNNPVARENGNSGKNFLYDLNANAPVGAHRLLGGGGGTIKVT